MVTLELKVNSAELWTSCPKRRRNFGNFIMKPMTGLVFDFLLLILSGLLLGSIYAHRYILALLDLGLTGLPERILRHAAKLTQNSSIRVVLLNVMALRTLRRGDHRLEWINRLIDFGWPYLNKTFRESLTENGFTKENYAQCGDLRFRIDKLELGARPPKVLSVLVHDESTFQVNPKQMILDLEVVYNSSCVAVVTCEFPLFGTIKLGIRNFKGDFYTRLTLRPIDLGGLGGCCISFLKKPKVDFEGIEATTFTNSPILKQLLIKMITDNIPYRICLPLNFSKVRQVAYPTPFAICNFQVACKMKVEKSFCPCLNPPKKVYVNLKICEKDFKVEVAPSLNRAVWHSTEVIDFLETFSLSRKEIDDNNYDLKLTFGSLINNDQVGKILKVPFKSSTCSSGEEIELDDHLTVKLVVLRLNNESQNINKITGPILSKCSKAKFPVGFVSIYFAEITFYISVPDCVIETQFGRKKFSSDKIFIRKSEPTTRIEDCFHVPFANIRKDAKINLQLIFNCEDCDFVSRNRIELKRILMLKTMEKHLELQFNIKRKVVAKVKASIEVTSVLGEELTRLMACTDLNIPLNYL